MSEPESPHQETKDWVYRDSTKRLLMALLLIGCAVSVGLEFFIKEKHPKFGIDGTFGFFALLGFISCTIMIFLAKLLGFVFKVPTDFYGDEDGEEDSPS